MQFAVGLKLKTKSEHVIVDAEDALIAALKVKAEHPEAVIMYVRRQIDEVTLVTRPAHGALSPPGTAHRRDRPSRLYLIAVGLRHVDSNEPRLTTGAHQVQDGQRVGPCRQNQETARTLRQF